MAGSVAPMRNLANKLILALMVGMTPWAFGSVEAWAELGIDLAIGILALLRFGERSADRTTDRSSRLPSIALGGLVLFAIFQTLPLGPGVLGWVSPSSALKRAAMLPTQPEERAIPGTSSVGIPCAAVSSDPDASIQMVFRLLAGWLLFQSVSKIDRNTSTWAFVSNVIVVNSVVLSLFSIVQALSWNGRIYWIRPAYAASGWSVGGPFLSHNHLAAYLNLGLGLAIGVLLSGNVRELFGRDSTKLWAAYAAAIIALGTVTSHSRSGFLGALGAGCLCILFLRGRLRQVGFGFALILIIVCGCLAILGSSTAAGARLATILDLGDQGYLARLEVWRGALRAWSMRPLFGFGLGTFPVAVTPFLTHDRSVFFARAENEYVDMLVEGGVVGLFLVLAWMVGIGKLVARVFREGSHRERTFVAGVGFGLMALAIQSGGDFAPHIPAVGVPALILCGLVVGLGSAARQGAAPEQRRTVSSRSAQVEERAWRVRWLLANPGWMGSMLIAAVLIHHGAREAWIEYRLNTVGLPAPGTLMATVGTLETASWELDDWRDALREAVRLRPNWTEGHVRLGLVELGLYRRLTKEWLEDSATDPKDINLMAEPLWLLRSEAAGRASSGEFRDAADLIQFEPVRDHLLSALHCFLEARRCCPLLALPHAELALLRFLMIKGDSTSVYATRALDLAGNDVQLIAFLARLAVQIGDRELAARCWRTILQVSPTRWPDVADEAVNLMTADELLSAVITDGKTAIQFAERLYLAGDQIVEHDRLLKAAMTLLASDQDIAEPERLYLQGRAAAGLNLRRQACDRMDGALLLEPEQSSWREDYIAWLVRWGRDEDAHKQALIGQYYAPDSTTMHQAALDTAERMAQGANNR